MNPMIRILALLIPAFVCGCSSVAPSSSRGPDVALTPTEAAMARGAAAFRLGRFADAVSQWSIAEAAYSDARNDAAQCDALIDLGAARVSLGNYPEAESSLKRALAAAHHDTVRLGAIYCGLANVYIASSRTGDADEILARAVDLATESNDEKLLERVRGAVGSLRACEGRFDEAAAAFEQCAQLARKTGDRASEGQVLANAARSAAWKGNSQAAHVLCQRAFDAVSAAPGDHAKISVLLSLGQTTSDLGQANTTDREARFTWARSAYHDALRLAKVNGDLRAASSALGCDGRLDEMSGKFDGALSLTQQAAFIAQKIQAPELLYRWQWQAARILKATGATTAAVEEYSHAVETLGFVRQDLALGYGNLGPHGSFRESIGPIYYELADLLLRQAGQSKDPATTQTLLSEARLTVEQLKNAELEDYFQDPCTNLLKSKARNIENVDPGTAVLYLIPLPDRTELLVGTSAGLRRVVIEVPAETLYAEVRLFRSRLEDRATRRYLYSAKRLYDWLIAPIEPQLRAQHIDTLVFVPDGVLRNIPMAALYDGSAFLITRYAIAVSPGLTIIDPHHISRQETRVLEAGLSQGVQGYPALRFVTREIHSLQNLFSGVTLLDQRFVVSNLKAELAKNQFSIVHIASHAQASSDLRRTFIVTYDSTISISELQRLLRPAQNLDRPIDLLTLSACQTAAGDDRAALGLAGMALKAGARSTLATLWSVNDEAGSLLIEDFYEALRRDPISAAKALQQAQIKLLNDLRYRHPGYWSPYIIVGNWL